MDLESNGDGHLLEDAEDETVEVDVEVEEEEGEGDMYLDETCLPLGLLCTKPLSFSEGKRGGLDGFWRWVRERGSAEVLGFGGSFEAASEMAATIIGLLKILSPPPHIALLKIEFLCHSQTHHAPKN